MSISLRTKVRRRLSKLKLQAYFARLAVAGNPVYTGEVNLEDVLIGKQCGTQLEKWVERTCEWNRASCLLKDSPYVLLLQTMSENESWGHDDDAYLETQPYYRMAQVAVEFSGSYFGAKTSQGIKRQMRAFYETYTSIRDGRCSTVRFDDYRHSEHGEPLLVSKIRGSTCYELADGHHRAAIFYMLGKRRLAARIAGEKATYLQRLVRQCGGANGTELEQPVETADVRGWTVRRKCRDRLELTLDFLRRQGGNHPIRTVLDAPCGYGWFVDQLCRHGLNAVGITPVAAHVKIGRVAYGLNNDTLRHQQTADALRQSDTRYDMVLFLSALHRYALGEQQEDECEILKLLDRVTGHILILDSGYGGEQWFRSKLPDWNDEHIRSRIHTHTTFKQVIPLGKDVDSRGAYEGQFGRTLFACIR